MWIAALLLGFLGSLHCLAMCGPIAFMLPLSHNNAARKTMQLSIYHLGRLLSYTILGLLFGLLGKGLFTFGMQQKLSIFIGVLMVILVLLPQKTLARYRMGKPLYKLIAKVKFYLGKELRKKSNDTFLTIGFLNGFLPCGLVYMALLGAISLANPIKGGLYMMLFGLGTVPLMTGTVYFGNLLKQTIKHKVQRLIPVIIILIGILFIFRGMGLGIPYISPKTITTVTVSSATECHNP